MRNRTILAVAVALFLVLAGTGTSSALWSSQASTSATVGSGTHAFSQTGFARLGATYSSAVTTDTASVRVRNTGTISAPFTLSITAPAANELATGVLVRTWPTAAACNGATAMPTSATSSNWTNVPVITGTLPGGVSADAFYCIRTSITSAQAVSLGGRSMTATATLTSAVGSWTTTSTGTATQSVTDQTAPSRPPTPIASDTSGYSTTLTWPASTDNAAVTGYRIFRNGVVLTTVTSPSYTDATLTNNTTYSYTVQAFDAVPNYSAQSPAVSVTTLPVVPATFYRVIGQGSGMCVDGNGASTADGTQLIIWGCHGNPNQRWRFTPTTEGFYSVAAQNMTTSVWTVAPGGGSTDGARVLLWNNLGNADQQWRITQQSPGVYTFVNRASSKCFDVQNNQAVAGTPLLQFTCNLSTAQSFTLAAD